MGSFTAFHLRWFQVTENLFLITERERNWGIENKWAKSIKCEIRGEEIINSAQFVRIVTLSKKLLIKNKVWNLEMEKSGGSLLVRSVSVMTEAVFARLLSAFINILSTIHARKTRRTCAVVSVVEGTAFRAIFTRRRGTMILLFTVFACRWNERISIVCRWVQISFYVFTKNA